MEKKFTLKAENGLHARPATNFVKFVASIPAKVELVYKEFAADAKSIMAIMSLGLPKDSVFIIRVDSDKNEYLDNIEKYLKEHNMI
ncbi:MAG: HPr family phosphocarrier protein [Tenericutes bacterium]|jgi:phosphocarrier protein HPr|nr:HPr family phosphocarrier protein [Mycoplasmatota bacterium]